MMNIPITTEFIRLESLLKLVSAVGTGGEAKLVIQQGDVLLDGAVCTERGKKLRPGDTVTYRGKSYTVSAK